MDVHFCTPLFPTLQSPAVQRAVAIYRECARHTLPGLRRETPNRVQSCRVGLDPPIREAIAVSRDSGLRVNDTPPVILSEAEESLQ